MVTELAYDVAALRKYLLSDADVNTLSGGRVFGNELPDAEAALMPRKCVVINSAGLGSRGLAARSYMPISSRTKVVRCYGETPYDTRLLFNAVDRALKLLSRRLVTPDGLSAQLLYSAVSTGGVTTAREQQTDWPVSFSSYDVLASDVV